MAITKFRKPDTKTSYNHWLFVPGKCDQDFYGALQDDPRIRCRRLLPMRPGRLPGAAPLPPQGRQSWHGRNVGEKLVKSWLKSEENLVFFEFLRILLGNE